MNTQKTIYNYTQIRLRLSSEEERVGINATLRIHYGSIRKLILVQGCQDSV
jgi:hypothetical protein